MNQVQIKLNNCKCGLPLKLGEGEEWSGFKVKIAFSYCPKRRWFNFWKHNKNVTHAWMPFPSVNKWKPGVKKQLKQSKCKTCLGVGNYATDWTSFKKCFDCNGTGRIPT